MKNVVMKMMKTKYVIKGIWDGQVCYYVGIDKNVSFFGIPVVRLSTSINEAMMFDSTDSVEEAYSEVSHATFKIYPVCPICGEDYSDPPAISRKDNKSKICPNCGTGEALMDFIDHLQKKKTTC